MFPLWLKIVAGIIFAMVAVSFTGYIIWENDPEREYKDCMKYINSLDRIPDEQFWNYLTLSDYAYDFCSAKYKK